MPPAARITVEFMPFPHVSGKVTILFTCEVQYSSPPFPCCVYEMKGWRSLLENSLQLGENFRRGKIP
jgi:hypothetical protein